MPLQATKNEASGLADVIDRTLEQMNWGSAEANLVDAVNYLQECRANLEKAFKNISELSEEEYEELEARLMERLRAVREYQRR
jgi:ElaB/YqjD/DUF883 family membrane-anchored ribosome-binding protein